MSIVLLNDLVFQYTEEGHVINKEICLFFLSLNLLTIFCCSLYLYIYYKIPHYQNNSNSLTLLLTKANLISGISYFLFFSDFYFRSPLFLTVITKIVTMINPLIIFTFYFWAACLTHNIYVTFYGHAKNLDKRVKFYKYQLIVYLFIFYIFTMFSIKFKEKQLTSNAFSFIENYRINYIILFYLIGLLILTYIISRLYYIVMKKSQSFSLSAPDERTLVIKRLFQSLIFRHMLFIFYFLFIFVPVNLMMMVKYMFRVYTFENFYVNFITLTLISLYGTFIFVVKLTESIIRDFLLSIILCNKSYIKEYESLLKKDNVNNSMEELTESFMEEKDIIIHVYKDFDKSFMTFYNETHRLDYEPEMHKNKYTSFNLGVKYKLHFLHGEKKDINGGSKDNIKTFSMKTIKKIKEERINPNNNNNNGKENNYSKFTNNLMGSSYSEKDEEKDNIIINNQNENNKNEKENNIVKNINININKEDEKGLSRVNTLKDSIYENDENDNRGTIDDFFIGKKKSYNCNDNILKNRRYSTNINNQILNLRYSHYSNTRQSKNEEEVLKNYEKRISVEQIKRKKKFISHTTKRSYDLISHKKYSSKNCCKHFYKEEISGYDLFNYHLEVNDNLQRLLAISICINDDRKYDNQSKYQQYYYSPLPWKETNFYREKTPYNKYNENNFPDSLNIKGDSRFNGIEFKVLSYSPFVFHHLRLLDKMSIDDILKSLDVKKNLKIINESKVTGGRGDNTIFRTWDKKIIIKTIDEDEKNLFINKMLEEYHERMRDTKSILSHILGVYKIELGDKGESNVMIQRNMNDQFLDSNILTFDLKGSTVDRQSIKKEDIDLKKKILFNKYKNVILKDIDLKITDIKIELNPYDGKNILLSICNDSMFLQKYDVTDYSLLIFINKYNKKNLEKHLGNSRVMPGIDDKYMFNFSIIDFLGTFNLEKKGEKLMKDFVGVLRASKDTNYSVQNPQNYGTRFRKFAKKIIIYDKEEKDTDNFSS